VLRLPRHSLVYHPPLFHSPATCLDLTLVSSEQKLGEIRISYKMDHILEGMGIKLDRSWKKK